LEIDPGAQDDAAIGVALPSRPDVAPAEPPKMLGIDYRPRVKWLTATWNKLGSYLHADWPFARAGDTTGGREFMEKIVSELERFVERTFTVAFANTTSFECSEYGGTVVASERGLQETGHATCLACWLRYSVREEEGGPFFYLAEPHIVCHRCQRKVFVPTVDIRAGYRLPCRNCGCVLEAVREDWVFQAVDSPAK
jgi:transcription elongation factor Elf1